MLSSFPGLQPEIINTFLSISISERKREKKGGVFMYEGYKPQVEITCMSHRDCCAYSEDCGGLFKIINNKPTLWQCGC